MKISIKLIFGLVIFTSMTYGMEDSAPKVQIEDAEQKSKADSAEIISALTKILLENKSAEELLRNAINSGNVELAKMIMPHVDLDKFYTTYNQSPFANAVTPEIVTLLIAKKADVNSWRDESSSPLINYCHLATWNWGGRTNTIECCKLLLDVPELHINAQKNGKTAPHCLAFSKDDTKIGSECLVLFEKLLTCGADPYIPNEQGKTVPQRLAECMATENRDYNKVLELCVTQREKDLKRQLAKYLDKDTTGIVIDYTWQDYEAATLPKKISKAIEASESDSDDE